MSPPADSGFGQSMRAGAHVVLIEPEFAVCGDVSVMDMQFIAPPTPRSR